MIYDQQYNSHDLHVVTATKAYILRAFCNVGKIFKYILVLLLMCSQSPKVEYSEKCTTCGLNTTRGFLRAHSAFITLNSPLNRGLLAGESLGVHT